MAAADYRACTSVFRKAVFSMSIFMLSDLPIALPAAPTETAAETRSAIGEWGDMALTAMFTVTAVLFVSFLAVVTGLF
jgi:hypothetical protein